MSSQVPEDSQKSQEAQLARLRDDLAGNAAFGRMRGRMWETLIGHARSVASASARDAMKQWDADNVAMRVMMNLIRMYAAEGLEIALNELMSALSIPRYRVTGETIPIEETGPYTLVVINPEETFALLRWMQEFDSENFANMRAAIGNVVHDGEMVDDPVRKRMVDRARECRREGVKTYGGMHTLLTAFSERLHKVPCKAVTFAGASFYPESLSHYLPSDRRRVCYDDQLHERQDPTDWARAKVATVTRPVPKVTCALGFPEEQSTILSAFRRDDQRTLVASWQFRYPRAAHNLGGAHKGFSVGFHPEAEHPRWKKERPPFASLGVSHGWGAILLPNSEPGVESWYPDKVPHFVLTRFIRKAKGNRW